MKPKKFLFFKQLFLRRVQVSYKEFLIKKKECMFPTTRPRRTSSRGFHHFIITTHIFIVGTSQTSILREISKADRTLMARTTVDFG